MIRKLVLITAIGLVAMALPDTSIGAEQGAIRTAVERLGQLPFFSKPIMWTGDGIPSESEAADLLTTASLFKSNGWDMGVGSLEAFINNHPQSGWTPSLRANLTVLYRDRGYYTRALDHAERAWAVVKDARSGPAKTVGDQVLSGWLPLLSSLGRHDKMRELFAQTEGRTLADSQQQLYFQSAKESEATMLSRPEVSYRCGTFALLSVGRVLYGTNFNFEAIKETPSPESGFSLAFLNDLANQNKLKLVPVRRLSGGDLVVPSVVHWKQNHYASILEQKGKLYRVNDPTFGSPRWLTYAAINDEASGWFMVPEEKIPSGWRQATRSESESVFGRGWPNNYHPYPPMCPTANGGCSTSCAIPLITPPSSINSAPGTINSAPGTINSAPGTINSAPGTINSAPGTINPQYSGRGMATWYVLEPYIDLWVKDVPVFYSNGQGESVTAKLSYQQRNPLATSTNLPNFGPSWNFDWFSSMHVSDADSDPSFTNYQSTLYYPSGGIVSFAFSDQGFEPYAHMRCERIADTNGNLLAFNIIDTSGTVLIYDYFYTNVVGELDAMMTRSISASKKTNFFNYQTTNGVVQLLSMIDQAGLTNVLRYSTNDLSKVIEVETPFGQKAQFGYDTNGWLTNITDAVGMSSAFKYDYRGWITNLTTPYGATAFEHTHQQANGVDLGGTNMINRSILVTHPNFAKELYMYRDDSRLYMPFSYDPSLLPEVPAQFNGMGEESMGIAIDNANMWYRNSFHWDIRGYARLSTNDMSQFTTNDYLKSTTKHWYHGDIFTSLTVSPMLSTERAPSLDGQTWGAIRSISRNGANGYVSTNTLPQFEGVRLPDGGSRVVAYQRNSLGHVTNEISSYHTIPHPEEGESPASTEFLLRTNSFFYATNEMDVVKIIGPDGHLFAGYSYDSKRRVTEITNAMGYVTALTYNTNGQINSLRTSAGLTTTNLFDADGWLVQTIDLEIGRTNFYSWTNGVLYSHINECGLAVTNSFDALNRLIGVKYPDGTSVSNVYSKLDIAAVKDRMGYWTYIAYNNARQLVSVTNALGKVTTFGYCSCGALESVTNALGQVTSYTYDNLGRRTAIMAPDSTIQAFSYDSLSRLVSVIDPLNHRSTNYYNNRSHLIAVSNALGQVRSIAYDINDRVTNTVDANGIAITTSFDDLGRVVTRVYPDGGVERFGYTSKGFVVYTNQLNQVARYGYDVAQRKIAETNANNEITSYTYNSSGDLLTLTDGKNQVTRWSYDEYCRVTNKVDTANTEIFRYKYDVKNRLTNRWSAAKGSTTYQYDAIGSVTNVVYPTSSSITLSYDALNRLTNMVDGVGTTVYGYTAAGQLNSEDGPWADDTVSYIYSSDHMRDSVSVPLSSGRNWRQIYEYDVGHRMSTVASPAGTFSYKYPAGSTKHLVEQLLLPGGAYITNAYDAVGRLLSTKLVNSKSAVLNAHAYIYNASSQQTKQTFTDGNFVDYVYDSNGQLTGATGKESGGTSRLHEQFGYAYDEVGNLINRTNNALVQSFSVNNLNQLSNVTRSGTLTVAGKTESGVSPVTITVNDGYASSYRDGTFTKDGFILTDGTNYFTAIAKDSVGHDTTNTISIYLPANAIYTFDSNGNMLSDGLRAFEYNDENQLTGVIVTNRWKSEFYYDGRSRRRIRKDFTWSSGIWSKTNEVRYVYDGNVVIQERNEANQSTATYTRGRDKSGRLQGVGGVGGLLAFSRHALEDTNQPSLHAYYHADANGNVMALVNPQQVIVAKYRYDPFGNVIAKSGILADVNIYRFSSKEWDSATGLYYYLYRYFDPNSQRWINRDPYAEKGGFNLYRFVYNNPLFFIDPLGLAEAGNFGETYVPTPWTGNGAYATPWNSWQPPPIQLMPPGGLVEPVAPSSSGASAIGNFAGAMSWEYSVEAGQPIGFTLDLLFQILNPPYETPEQMAWTIKYGNPPPGVSYWCPPKPTTPPPPPPPPSLWNSGSDVNAPPVIAITGFIK